jgi:(R,R)-butanediol dehydrogenase / meso-butanediol dehydrogenase / diacetyl reductase
MRAATFVKAGQELLIEEVQDPVVGVSELIIRVKACGICGSDLHMADVYNFNC